MGPSCARPQREIDDCQPCAAHTLPALSVQTRRIGLALPAIGVTTLPFRVTESVQREQRPAVRPATLSRIRTVGSSSQSRPALAACVPLADRVQSVLQPPISLLFDDPRLWLPCEPFGFQIDGIAFLMTRWAALLADEMGLGKTMQTILAIRLLLRSGELRSCLVVCPKPLVSNWLREFSLWADEIPVQPIQGDMWSRQNRWRHDSCPVKIANYESLARDEASVNDRSLWFDLVVLDEAQRIKNRDSKSAQVVRRLRRSRSWALTGTPVENHAGDLASLLEFVHQRPVAADEGCDTLRNAMSGVLLRRTKEKVLLDLPEKLVRDAYVDLGPGQQESYRAAEKEGVFRLNDLGDAITIEHVFELIRRLKQICNFDPVTGESSKAEHLAAGLEELASSGRKAIVFSQWVTTLECLAERLARFRPLLFHGKVPSRLRDQVLSEFRRSSERAVLLLSYGSGAVGLNLQCANYVFLFDRWWNPAVEDQAINRAHRVGQRQPVFVSRFLVPGTIEERIAAVLERKRELFNDLFADHEAMECGGLTREDVFGLFDLRVRAPAMPSGERSAG